MEIRRDRLDPRGLEALLRHGPGRFIEPSGNYRNVEFRCPMTGIRYVQPDDRGGHRALEHFASRWANAIGHLHQAGLDLEGMVAPLERLGDQFAAEATREVYLENHVGYDPDRYRGLRVYPPPARDDSALSIVALMNAGLHRGTATSSPKRAAAEKKARETLRLCLTEEQRAEFDARGEFTVTVPVEGRANGHRWKSGHYLIRSESTFNVTHVASGVRYCLVAAEPVPLFDNMLTQKLLLENDPPRFFATANASDGGINFGDEYLAEFTEISNRMMGLSPPGAMVEIRPPPSYFTTALQEMERHMDAAFQMRPPRRRTT